MNELDFAIIIVVVVSALIGVVRGFIRETLSLIAWITALWLAFVYAEPASAVFIKYIKDPTLRLIAAFTAIFVATVLVLAIVSYFLHKVLVGRGVRGTDRVLGGLFGIARGIVVIAGLLLLANAISLPYEQWVRNSLLVKHVQPVVKIMADLLPEDFRKVRAQAGKSGIP
jgi:membrane protein required for colicin V production